MDCFFTLGVKLSLVLTSVHFAMTLIDLQVGSKPRLK